MGDKRVGISLDLVYDLGLEVGKGSLVEGGAEHNVLFINPSKMRFDVFLDYLRQHGSEIKVSPFYVEMHDEIQRMKLGRMVEASLIKNIFSYQYPLGILGVGGDIVDFKDEGLEQKMEDAKEEFYYSLNSCNVMVHTSKFHYRIHSEVRNSS